MSKATAIATSSASSESRDVPEAKVIGPATPVVDYEETVPLKPKRAVATTTTTTTSRSYTCCGFALPCLGWLSVCGCSFVGCAWLGTCWKRMCGGQTHLRGQRRRREVPGGGLSFVQNLLTCWRCCGLLPACCPGAYMDRVPRNGAVVATPVPLNAVEETKTGVAIDTRPMPALYLA